jgi:hypothetical protein
MKVAVLFDPADTDNPVAVCSMKPYVDSWVPEFLVYENRVFIHTVKPMDSTLLAHATDMVASSGLLEETVEAFYYKAGAGSNVEVGEQLLLGKSC